MLPSILLAVVALFFMIKWWLETKKTKGLNKEVLAQKNELGLNKDFSDAILRNIDAYIVLANRNFLVEKTNYYSLNSEKDDCVLHRVGELLRCKNALDSGACGTHENCKSCPVRASIERCFREKNSFSRLEAPMRLYLSDDTDNYVDCVVSVSGAYMVQNRDEKVLLTVRDITRLKKVQEELEAARRVAEVAGEQKTAFLANMSHEIRTPLNAIVGFSSLLTSTENAAEKELYNSLIGHNNKLLLNLINDVIDLSKIESGYLELRPDWVNLTELLDESVAEYAHQVPSGVELLTNYPAHDSLVELDRLRIKQILSNFLSNALKNTTTGHVEIFYEVDHQSVRIGVKDTGGGIPQNMLEKIFERFEKLDSFAQGAGLGLPICKLIVEKMNGRILVDSQLGIGTTFIIELPCRSMLVE